MTHLDLFSGIGGFAYALDQIFDDVEHVFCDYDKFCRAVLRKHWPESEILHDIKEIDTNPFDKRLEGIEQEEGSGQSRQSDRARQNQESRSLTPDTNLKRPLEGRAEIDATKRDEALARSSVGIDILTGGFPCQPFSAAGLRGGTADDRYLWPEMLRVIQLTKPEWVIAENVGGLATWNEGLVLETVCSDLEAEGYEVQPLIIPAVAVNAPHRRDRIWFIAHAIDGRPRGAKQGSDGATGSLPQIDRPEHGTARQSKRTASDGQTPRHATDAGRLRGISGRSKILRPKSEEPKWSNGQFTREGYSWDTDWNEVATKFCRVDDGLPARVGGLELSKPQHRKEQLKAYGNAIVPQVAYEIMLSIFTTN